MNIGIQLIWKNVTKKIFIWFIYQILHCMNVHHTYPTNMSKSRMNPKIQQYLIGHSEASVTMNVYTYICFDDAEEEQKWMREFREVQDEIEKNDAKAVLQKTYKVV